MARRRPSSCSERSDVQCDASAAELQGPLRGARDREALAALLESLETSGVPFAIRNASTRRISGEQLARAVLRCAPNDMVCGRPETLSLKSRSLTTPRGSCSTAFFGCAAGGSEAAPARSTPS
eukprot:3143365-Prymnesium_polylepis.1